MILYQFIWTFKILFIYPTLLGSLSSSHSSFQIQQFFFFWVQTDCIILIFIEIYSWMQLCHRPCCGQKHGARQGILQYRKIKIDPDLGVGSPPHIFSCEWKPLFSAKNRLTQYYNNHLTYRILTWLGKIGTCFNLKRHSWWRHDCDCRLICLLF